MGSGQMNEKVRCGGHYCKKCKKCITPPRLIKHFIEDYWTVCDECEENVFRMIFMPREEAIKVDFYIHHQDIPRLIKELQHAFSLYELNKKEVFK